MQGVIVCILVQDLRMEILGANFLDSRAYTGFKKLVELPTLFPRVCSAIELGTLSPTAIGKSGYS